MKRPSSLLLVAFVLSVAGNAQAQGVSASRAEGSRKFFPRDWVRGFADFAIAPPHNEPDLGRCAAWAGADGGANAPCSAFARYVASGYIELQPINAKPFDRIFFFAEPHFFFGRNVPQFQYSISAIPMAYEHAYGMGLELRRNFELRVTEHSVDWLGRYSKSLGIADMGKNGPLGLYTTISARWYFGGWRLPR